MSLSKSRPAIAEKTPDSDVDSIQCRPYSWAVKIIEGQEEIHVWCWDRQSRNVMVRIQGFQVPCIIELKKRPGDPMEPWSSQLMQRHILQELNKKVNKSFENNNGPYVRTGHDIRIKGSYQLSTALYFSDKKNVLLATCPSTQHLRRLEWGASKNLFIDPTGLSNPCNKKVAIRYEVLEGSKIDTIVKFIVNRNITHTQWITIPKKTPSSRQAVGPFGARFEQEYAVGPDDVVGVTEDTAEWKLHPKVFMFDEETYSNVHKNLPNKDWVTNAITDISFCTYRDGDRDGKICGEPMKEYAFVFGDVEEKGDSVILKRCHSEKYLLEEFVAFLVREDPDVFSGYNISGYDWDYLYARMKVQNVEWPDGACRLKDTKVVYNDKISIKINPKLTRNLMNLEFEGRITLDVYYMAIREYGFLPMQNLNTVAKFIIERGKHDVSPEEMFKAHEKLLTASEAFAKITKSWRPMTDEDELLFSSHYGVYPVFHDNVSKIVIDKIISDYEEAKEEKGRVSYYCDEDTRLCVDIAEKSNMITNIIELSGIVGVQPRDVYTRGEQLRGLTHIYRECRKLGVIVDKQLIEGLKGAAGGHVGKMVPGYYKNVITLDFKSMYPSIIMGYNICYSTYVPPDKAHEWRDDQCNIIEWDQQVVTEEQRGRKKKKTKIFNEDGTPTMEHHRYRFVKAEIRPGIIPKIVGMLVDERNNVRAKIETLDDEKLKQIYDIRQKGLKVAGNSMYGLMGVGDYGTLPFKIGSMCTAAMGRELIIECNRIIEEECHGTIVYNDTDSTMFQIKGVTTGSDMIDVGDLLGKYISDRFPDPLYFAFEKCGDFLGFTPKKYVYWLVDAYSKLKDGSANPGYGFLGDLSKPEKSLLLRGNVLVRRDNPDLLKGIYMDNLRNVLVDQALLHSDKIDAEGILETIKPYAKEIGISLDIQRIPDTPEDRPRLLQESMHRTFDAVCELITDLATANVNLRDLIITGGINDDYATETSKMNMYFHRLQAMGKQVSRGDRVAFMVKRRPGFDKLGERMFPVDVFCEMHEDDPEESPDIFYYINNVLAKPLEQLITIAYKDVLQKKEHDFELDLYNKMYTRAVELLQEGVRVFYTKEKALEIVYNGKEGARDSEGKLLDLESAKENFTSLLKSTTARIRSQVSGARRELLTGRAVFNMNMSMHPLIKLAKAYEKDYFREFLDVLCSEETSAGLVEKLDKPHGNWKIDQVLREQNAP